MKILKTVLIINLLAACNLSHAEQLSPNAHPKTYCDLAISLGYPSRGYKETTGGCASNMKLVGSEGLSYGDENNLAFYVMSETDNPKNLLRITLILNVNNVTERNIANAELARVATGLYKKILGSSNATLETAILKEKSQKWTDGKWRIEIKNDVWKNKKGYDTTIYFLPAEGKVK